MDELQLKHLKEILQTFSDSTGLKVNHNKYQMILINDSKLARLAEVFGCQVGTMPFTYLGVGYMSNMCTV